jgi:hypothetical protein
MRGDIEYQEDVIELWSHYSNHALVFAPSPPGRTAELGEKREGDVVKQC